MSKQEAEEMYDSHNYSCGGYFCTVATTCYEPEKKREICVSCIMDRYFNKIDQFEQAD